MTFKPAIWFPISAVLSVVNLVAVGFAAVPAEPAHAVIHAVLALAFGLWAQRLRQRPGGNEKQSRVDVLEAQLTHLQNVQMELIETQERLDFADQLLAQRPESLQVNAERYASKPPDSLERP